MLLHRSLLPFDDGPVSDLCQELDGWRTRLDSEGPCLRIWQGRLRRDLEAEAVAASTSMEGVPVTVDEMLFLTRTVARSARHPIVVGDMPFGSFQVSDEKALENAIRFVKEAGADAVKLEGAGPMVSRVKTMVDAGISVMGHVGLTPQSATKLGGFKTQGKTAEAAAELVEGALALEEAGAFAVVLEAVPAPVAAEVTRRLTVPTIGIGAGPDTDGQVLVYHDLLGLTEGHLPRFVKRYASLSREIRDALEAYAGEVRSGAFPDEEHAYEMSEEELALFEQALGGGR